MKEWCLGFIFTPHLHNVVLLKKSRTLHIDRWNGLGGKIEGNESGHGSMVRECKEESGLDVPRWQHVGYLRGSNVNNPWIVFIYAVVLGSIGITEITAEWEEHALKDIPYLVPLNEITYLRMAPHSRALIHACLDKIRYPETPIMELKELKELES